MNIVTKHPWSNDQGVITPTSAAVAVASMILSAGSQASTAFKCAAAIAVDLENKGFPHTRSGE